ncbi:MAG: right-handed parallel beta-helix repeat-containing protein, partial [Rectinemataceae bacterium]|nr:right-handed parallel beta-helix repeat-containing protein [Rectinemataceae bacterium]
LNNILVMPTVAYSWYKNADSKVTITPNSTKTVQGADNKRFNYILKQDSFASYLIVVNKDASPLSSVNIKVNGLSGPMTAKKIIGSTTTANQDAAVNNGLLVDSFEGFAVHVYQMYSGFNPPPFPVPAPPAPDTTPPAIAITCPGSGNTYSSNTISVSGTASDNVGVSKVEVKVGAAGAYQTATGTTSWSISGITIVAGLNTVYARATDTSGNTKETFIQVTYDATMPPPPSVTCTKFVAKNGNDANSGTEASPWLTIQKAANVAVAGDTVCVKAGTYNERVIVKNSGNAGNWITFAADPNAARDTVIIDGTGISIGINEGLVHIQNKSYIKFTGFKIQNSNGGGITVSGRESSIAWSNVTIENNYIYNTAGGGIIGFGAGRDFIMNKNEIERASGALAPRWPSEQVSLQWDINGFIFSNNEVHHNGKYYTDNWRGGEGPTFKEGVSNGKVFGNHIHHMKRTADINGQATGQTTGIYTDGFTMGVTNIDIYNNRVHDITGFGIVVNSELQGTNESTTVRNNLVYNNTRWGIALLHGGDEESTAFIKNTKIINNTIYNNGERGICVTRDATLATGLIIRNNISSNNGQSQLDIRNADAVIDYNLTNGPGSTVGANPVVGDPQFVNPAAFDFRIQSTSPAINAGTPTNAPAFDFANGPRPWPVAGAFDIGAYEFGSPPGPGNFNFPPNCTAPSSPSLCGNGIIDTGEFCEKTTNQGCSSPSICNSDCAACVAPPPPPPICYGVICNTPGFCQKGLGRCIEANGNPVCVYYYDPEPCEDNDGDPCKMGRCSSSDGGRTGFCDKAKSDVVCGNPGFCQAGIGECVATSLLSYICAYNDDPDPCDLDGNVCTYDVCKSSDGGFSGSCVATNLDACEG